VADLAPGREAAYDRILDRSESDVHLLAWLALILAVVAAVATAVGLDSRLKTRAWPGRPLRTRWTAWILAVGAALLSLSIGASLLLSQHAVCDALGGRWIAPEDACRDEFGGNGNNDVGRSWAPLS
jgi:hypothetical protein